MTGVLPIVLEIGDFTWAPQALRVRIKRAKYADFFTNTGSLQTHRVKLSGPYVLDECGNNSIKLFPIEGKWTSEIEPLVNLVDNLPIRQRDACCAGVVLEAAALIVDQATFIVGAYLCVDPLKSQFTCGLFRRAKER